MKTPSHRSQIRKPFKFYHHVIDHPDYCETVRTAWQPDMIEGSNQYKLVRSMKCLKKELRRLNRTHFSGITRRVREQSAKVDILQRALLTSPDRPTAIEEHQEGEKLNKLRIAELKFYRQRSRVRWADVGNRNTNFYHKTVDQRICLLLLRM
ncbi:hypothetical protein HID58_065752 [Brassica napus]|uniref:Uncharacterized protein n=1 Tax=Brassica napus TaxID=3708 RepID=A0ABQ7ZDR6_BRANA|nr:hypothetical protein HID58_065752 [Brassica napus]